MSRASAELLLALSVLFPLACTALHAPPPTRAIARTLTPWAALPALLSALILPLGTSVRFDWLLLGVELGLDATSQVFLLFTSLLWWLSGISARAHLRHDPRVSSFLLFFALAQAGNLGLIVARDLVGFYACFVLMSLASYGLVVHGRSEASLRAGRIYLAFALAGELALFAGLAGLAGGASSPRFDDLDQAPSWALALAVVGFGIKAGALGLHCWLPLAHPAAPVAASAVLSGAMIKAGLLGWLRVLPLGSPGFESWGGALFAAGVAAAFYGAAVGITQREPKAVLAYSSVSQMGLMTAGLGFGLALPAWGEAARVAVLLYAIHHALAKSALFLGVGVASRVGSTRDRALRLALALPALSLAGAPLTSGALAKSLLKTPLGQAVDAGPGLVLLLSLAAVGTTLLMVRFLASLPRGTRSAPAGRQLPLLLPWLALLVLGPVLALTPWPAVGTTSLDLLTPPKLALALAPVVAGFGLAGLARLLARRWPWLRLELPPGDVLVLLARAPRPQARGRLAIGRHIFDTLRSRGGSIRRAADRLEEAFRASTVAGALWSCLALGLLLLAALE